MPIFLFMILFLIHPSFTKASEGPIYYNRQTRTLEHEKVLGEDLIRWAYQTKFGYFLTKSTLRKRSLSKLYGAIQNSKRSQKKIPQFVKDYNIDMSQFETKEYTSFNDFFIRKFKPGLRPFSDDLHALTAGVEARYTVYENLSPTDSFTVKGIKINLYDLLEDLELASEFEGGTLLIARLAPVDYHRFHFPLDASWLTHKRIHGDYHSVNPIALQKKPDILLKNERHVSVLDSKLAGRFIMIEVGAFGVGRIVQSCTFPSTVRRGEEKGYFMFGGSTVLFIFQKHSVKIEADILEQSKTGIETLIQLGERIGSLH